MKNQCYKLLRMTIIIIVFKQVCNKMIFVFSFGSLKLLLQLQTNNGKTISKNNHEVVMNQLLTCSVVVVISFHPAFESLLNKFQLNEIELAGWLADRPIQKRKQNV